MENSRFFPEIHGNFGFGCMRLPMKGGSVDYEEFCRMADAFIEAGFNYFDTAHAYLGGLSETAIRDCVAKRYPREKFLLTNKLTTPYFNKQGDIRPFVESQLKLCGVDYFDFYLMHAQDRNNYQKYKRCQAYETCYALKQEGLIRHFGISFHDKADVLDLIPCTACRYCIEESSCPKGIRIPDLFAAKNAHEAFHNWNTGYYYNNIITGGEHGKASDCIKCGKCEKVCPQHLPIRQLLRDVARTFET